MSQFPQGERPLPVQESMDDYLHWSQATAEKGAANDAIVQMAFPKTAVIDDIVFSEVPDGAWSVLREDKGGGGQVNIASGAVIDDDYYSVQRNNGWTDPSFNVLQNDYDRGGTVAERLVVTKPIGGFVWVLWRTKQR